MCNTDEVVTSDGEEVTKPIAGASVGRSQSDRTGEIRRETERIESSTSPTLVNTIINSNDKVNATSATIATTTTTATSARVSDAASQTTPAPSPPPPPVLPRRQLQEEIECDQLSRDLASQLSPSHKLHGILGKDDRIVISFLSIQLYNYYYFFCHSVLIITIFKTETLTITKKQAYLFSFTQW